MKKNTILKITGSLISIICIGILVQGILSENNIEKENTNVAIVNTNAKIICEHCTSNEPSQEYLVPIRDVNYSKIKSGLISNYKKHEIQICQEHFSSTLSAGQEFYKAIREINQVPESDLYFDINEVEHKNNFELLPDKVTSSNFEYINVLSEMPKKCYLPDDLTFAMRSCVTNSFLGKKNNFSILVKSTTYQQFSDFTSSDHPQKHGILHELGHAFGMSHSAQWEEKDFKYISTMQGNLEYLSPLDIAFLQHYYPAENNTINHRNYVASSLTRFDNKKGVFEKQNPSKFYLDKNNTLKDCATNNFPEYKVAWFNNGNLDSENSEYGVNKIIIREKNNSNSFEIISLRMAPMPYLSQDQWQGISSYIIDPSELDFEKQYELVFITNAEQNLDESTFEDNEIAMDIEIFQHSCN